MGNTGEYYPATLLLGERSPSSGAGPGGPAGAGVGGMGSSGERSGGTAPGDHPSGPVGPLALPVSRTLRMPSLDQRGDI